ncbi:MAG TPA: hypothetical protein VIL63_14210 [Terriglobales bacterium]
MTAAAKPAVAGAPPGLRAYTAHASAHFCCRVEHLILALARRLAVIMHRIWVDGTEFQWTRESAAA